MKTISLCMIVKDEEKNIENCLSSVHDLVDEIIIVDTGSTDKTKEICKQYTNNVYDFEWIYDFSAARNYSKSKATMEYIWWLDADDILLEEDRIKFKKFKESMDGFINNFSMICNYRHNQNGECTFSFPQTRIVKNTNNVYWTCVVHELLNHDEGYELPLDIHITHTTNDDHNDRSVIFFEKSMELGHILNTREKYYYGGELFVQGRIDDSIKILEEFVSDINYNNDFELARGYNYLARAYNSKNDYSNSIRCYLNQIAKSHSDMETFYKIAENYQLLKQFKTAILYFNMVCNETFEYEKFMNSSEYDISHRMEFELELKFKAHLNLVLLYHTLGKIDLAIYHNEQAGLINPDSESVIFNKKFFNPKLKILMVGPNTDITIPPLKYGGVEQVIYNLTEDLIKLGHDVTILGPEGSHCSGSVIIYDKNIPPEMYIKQNLDLLNNFDIIHDHSAFVGQILKDNSKYNKKIVCTNHYHLKYNLPNPVFVSKASQNRLGEREDLFIYNGINLEDYIYSENKKDFLLFIGRIDRAKCPDRAIRIAKNSNKRLIIAGPIHDEEYFNQEIKPFIDGINIIYIGEVGGKYKAEVLSEAECVLFTSTWDEPFGLVLIEAMASGTPVVAFNCGASREVLSEIPYMIGKDEDELTSIIKNKNYPNSETLLNIVKQRFTREIMTKEYLKVYKNLNLKGKLK